MKISSIKSSFFFRSLLFAVLFLFFLQLASDLVESIYSFGLLATGFTVDVLNVLFFFSPLVLLFTRQLPKNVIMVLGGLFVLSRVVEPLLDPHGKVFFSGLGVGSFLVFLPAFLWYWSKSGERLPLMSLGTGLALGWLLSVTFHALGSGLDLSTWDGFQALGWILAAAAALLLIQYGFPDRSTELPPGEGSRPAHGFGTLTCLSIGTLSAFIMLYFALAHPTVIARWTGVSYMLILGLLVIILAVFTVLLVTGWLNLPHLHPTAVWIWNLAFLLALVLTILPYQVAFPTAPATYPIPEPVVTFLAIIPLVLMLILSPVIVVDFILFAGQITAGRFTLPALGGGFLLAGLFFILLVFGHVFTTVYDYVPLIGPFFRDKFWLVYLIAGLGFVIPLGWVRRDTRLNMPDGGKAGRAWLAVGSILLAACAFFGGFWVSARPTGEPGSGPTLKVLTYNLQQGYSADGVKNFDGQLEVLRQMDADIIGLQETDMARLSGGNSDIVRYFADRLNLYSYYGPKTVTGTFGIALLSKVPLEDPQTFFMYSTGEQTATIEARVTVRGKTYSVFVTHLGNGGPIIQLENLLQRVTGKSNIIAMGDFNFRPDTDQYRLITQELNDSWLLGPGQPAENSDLNPAKRIDYIYISPGMQVADSKYLVSPQSDHPALFTEIQPESAGQSQSDSQVLIQELKSLIARRRSDLLAQPGWLHQIIRYQRPPVSNLDWEALPEKYEEQSWLLLDSQGRIAQAVVWVLDESGKKLQVRLIQNGVEQNLSLGFERQAGAETGLDLGEGFIEQASQLVEQGNPLNKQILYNNCWYIGEKYMLVEPGLLHEAVFNPDNGKLHSLATWNVSPAGVTLVSSLEVAVEEKISQPPSDVMVLFGKAAGGQ